jgi:hypothetical protein
MNRENLIGYAFWAIVSPFILVAGVYVVGATVEHFTP